MENGQSFRHRKTTCAEDQLTFNRWLKANAVVGLILAAGLVAMAVAGSNSAERRDAAVADRTKASDVLESDQRRRRIDVLPRHEHAIGDNPF
jgi:hypothetical protein